MSNLFNRFETILLALNIELVEAFHGPNKPAGYFKPSTNPSSGDSIVLNMDAIPEDRVHVALSHELVHALQWAKGRGKMMRKVLVVDEGLMLREFNEKYGNVYDEEVKAIEAEAVYIQTHAPWEFLDIAERWATGLIDHYEAIEEVNKLFS